MSLNLQVTSLKINVAGKYDFSMFEFWLSDYAGHSQNMEQACTLLETFDQVIEGLLSNWDFNSGIILITSDHGNLEDLSTRRHTRNPVPALIIGETKLRNHFSKNLSDLSHVAPSILSSRSSMDSTLICIAESPPEWLWSERRA